MRDVTPADFQVTVPTVASFTLSPATPGINQDVFFNASASTPAPGPSPGISETGDRLLVSRRHTRIAKERSPYADRHQQHRNGVSSLEDGHRVDLTAQRRNVRSRKSVPGVNQDVFFNASTSSVSNGPLPGISGTG